MKYRVITSTETGRTRLTIGQSNGPISDIYVQYINTWLPYNKLPEFTALPSSITIPDSGVLSTSTSRVLLQSVQVLTITIGVALWRFRLSNN